MPPPPAAPTNPGDFDDAAPLDAKVNYRSSWRDQQPSVSSTGVNTAPLKVHEAEVQTTDRASISTQTDGKDAAAQASKPTKKGQADVADFFTRVEGMISGEIKKAQEEHEELEPLTRTLDDKVEPASVLHELTAFPDAHLTGSTGTQSVTQQARSRLVVTSVTWSSTGQSIAAAYGRYDIAGWCTDRGALAVWNLGREAVDGRKPDTLVDVDNCLMAAAFHPEHPALIAGGTFNGDLYVWDLAQEADPQRAKSDMLSDLRHREPITSIVWQYSAAEYGKYGNRAQAYRLVTLGADGRVMVWVWHKLGSPVYGYQLLHRAPGVERPVLWGGTCMAFQRDPATARSGEGASTFLVGTEGGKIFRCLHDANDIVQKEWAKAAAAGQRCELRTPIREAGYVAHAGAVYGLDTCPAQRDLFLTCGCDGTVRLYHALKQAVLLSLEPSSCPVHAVQWSPVRPMVFAAAAGDGRVYLYDLLRVRDLVRPVVALECNPGGPVYAAAFNPKRPELFATGDGSGVQVWKLPAALAGVRKGEEALVRRMAAAEDTDEFLRTLRMGAVM